MVTAAEEKFEGLDCVRLDNGLISVWITSQVGPRVLGLSLGGGNNLFLVAPDAKLPVAGRADYSLRGGHRLWYAPETPGTTYITDDLPPAIKKIEGGLEVTQDVDEYTGIQKSWQMVLSENETRVKIDHKLTNLGKDGFRLAPWAVTMLRPGGRGILPLQVDNDDVNGLWPNRHLVIWPYTNLGSPHLRINNQAVLVEANLIEGALKIGTSNPVGWLGYALEGILFVKHAAYDRDSTYLDRSASSQIFTNEDLLELETLGPVVDLAPGESVTHQEVWQVYAAGMWPAEIESLFNEGG